MNNFTQEELILIACWSGNRCDEVGIKEAKDEGTIALSHKIQDMIDNYREYPWDSRKIAESHLREAESLISHAMCLLDMKEKQ